MSDEAKPPLIGVVVLNFNGWADTAECLASLRLCTWSRRFAIVVDNGSTTPGAEGLQASYPEVELVRSPSNVGFAAGMNLGTRRALERGADLIVLLNNDTVVDAAFLEPFAELFATTPDFGGASPLILWHRGGPTDRIWYAGGTLSRLRAEGGRAHVGEAWTNGESRPCRTSTITGCCLVVSGSSLARHGALDEDFFLGFEDVEFSWRHASRNSSLWFVPASRVWHKEGRSREYSAREIRSNYASKFLLMKKRLPVPIYYLWLVAYSCFIVTIKLPAFARERRQRSYAAHSVASIYRAIFAALGSAYLRSIDTHV